MIIRFRVRVDGVVLNNIWRTNIPPFLLFPREERGIIHLSDQMKWFLFTIPVSNLNMDSLSLFLNSFIVVIDYEWMNERDDWLDDLYTWMNDEIIYSNRTGSILHWLIVFFNWWVTVIDHITSQAVPVQHGNVNDYHY